MLDKLKQSQFHGKVKLVTKLEIVLGTAAIIAPRRLLFWPERAPENRQVFDLYGIERRGWETDGLSMIITNCYEKSI